MGYLEKEYGKINVPPDIITKANNGDAVAQLELGKAYFSATFVEENCYTAFKWLSRSAEQGNMEAQFRLGDLYAHGHGTLKSVSDAYKWYTKAAIQGYKKALIRIHNLYQYDTKMHCRGQISSEEEEWADKDFKQKNWIRELYEYRLEQKKSILNHAISYFTKQFKYYQSSSQEDPTVQLNMAFLYQHGYGVKKYIKWAFEYYTKAAEQGNIDAQYNLGNLYQKHSDMKFNYRHAYKWYTASAQGGNMAAQRSLAYFYLKGLATGMDYGIALSWYIKAAESGDSESQVILGKLYRKGDYIKQDLPMAVKWYTLAARQGNIVAQNCLSQLYQRGKLSNIELDQDMAEYFRNESMEKRLCTKLSMDIAKLGDSPELKQLEELAKRALIGDGQAMYEAGLLYYHGDKDFMQDEETGVKWIKNAAIARHKHAQATIAKIYKKGDSVEQDYCKAAIWYKKLAKQKDAAAQCQVGVMYEEGLGNRKDPLEASKWYIWAADQGDSNAQLYLSQFRLDGIGVRKDEEEAVDLLNKSVRQRNVEACCSLGLLYSRGTCGVEYNIEYGLIFLKYAAKHGSTGAQLILAEMFKRGDGFQQDMEKCAEYYEMACEAGSDQALHEMAMYYLADVTGRPDDYKGYEYPSLRNNVIYIAAKELILVDKTWDSRLDVDYSTVLDLFIDITKEGADDSHYLIGYKYEQGVYDRSRAQDCLDINYAEAEQWYSEASNNGDSRADYRLGIMHEFGKGVDKNLDKAIQYYERASLKENTDSSYRLACIYLDGCGVTQDLLKAFDYYTKASILGHELAIGALLFSEYNNKILLYYNDDSSYYNGDGSENRVQITINEELKLKMLEKATEEGYTQLQYQIGVWYQNKNDDSSAFKWLSRAAYIGVTDAYYRVGVLYEEGKDVKKDYTMAANMYHKATEKEHWDAFYRLGRLYQYGNGVELSYLKAYQLYQKAQEMGNAEAHKVLNITLETTTALNREDIFMDPSSQEYQDSLSMCKYVAKHGDTDVQFQVGFAYEHAVSESDYVEAFNWYSMAAERSHKEGIYHLGLLYEKGLGIPQDYQKAILLYNRAAQLDSDKALYQLGGLYHHGNGVSIDSIKATDYYTRSANMGNPECQCLLGRLYEDGELVRKNPLEALKWYNKSYLQGYDGVSSNLYAMYQGKQYQDFYFTNLVKNLTVASNGYFLLNEDYEYDHYHRLNIRLALFYALGCGTKRDLGKSWVYLKKACMYFSEVSVPHLLDCEFDLSISEKLDILRGIEENVEIMKNIDGNDLYDFATTFSDNLAEAQQLGCDDDQGKSGCVRYIRMDEDRSREFRIMKKYYSKVSSIIEKDYSRVFRCMKKAAGMDHRKAMFQLGIMYCSGYGVEKNFEEGENWFIRTGSNSLKFTQRTAVLFHMLESMQNFTLAHKWYRRLETLSVEQNTMYLNDYADLGLGLLYEYGHYVEQDYQKAFQYYTKLENSTRSIGMLRLALMYYYGKGVAVDYRKSFESFKKLDVEWGMYGAGLPYVYNQTNFNENDSHDDLVYCLVSYHEMTAETNYYLGLHYKYGQGVSCDQEKAQHHFRKALDLDCKRAEYEIDAFYSNTNI